MLDLVQAARADYSRTAVLGAENGQAMVARGGRPRRQEDTDPAAAIIGPA
jgi:hypothetical protein